MHQLFEEQVVRAPSAVAVRWREQVLTYKKLNERANQVAHCLRARGIAPDTTVGVCLERSPDLIVALLGVLKAGAAYVPLDPDYPAARLAFMLGDSGARLVVTQDRVARRMDERLDGSLSAQSVQAERLLLESIDQDTPKQNLTPVNRPADLAYVIYTSGSTGTPKGVAIEHRNTAALLHWVRTAFTTEELAGVLAATSVCFDLSVFEIFGPLAWGGQVILAQNALDRDIGEHWDHVQLINTVPSVMAAMLKTLPVPTSPVTVNLAGEPLKPALVDAIHNQWPVRRVNDLYGPSETTTYSTWATRQLGGPATIGKPIANTQVYLLDEDLSLVPPGGVGEICIGGAGVARGYLHRPELTEQRFVYVQLDAGTNQRLYRTGDLGMRRDDGTLVYRGRRDHQVKVRGFRIELGEVETVLEQHPDVVACAVVVQGDGEVDGEVSGVGQSEMGDGPQHWLRSRVGVLGGGGADDAHSASGTRAAVSLRTKTR